MSPADKASVEARLRAVVAIHRTLQATATGYVSPPAITNPAPEVVGYAVEHGRNWHLLQRAYCVNVDLDGVTFYIFDVPAELKPAEPAESVESAEAA